MYRAPIAVLLPFLLLSSAWAEDPAPLVTSVSVPGTTLEVNLTTQVGQPFDAQNVEKDVHYLWGLNRFDDVKVEQREDAGGIALVYRVVPRPHLTLHEIRIEPNTFGIELRVAPGTVIDRLRAHEIAMEAQKQLAARGYAEAEVTEQMVPLGHNNVDLKLHVDTGEALRMQKLKFEGDSSMKGKVKALKIYTILPKVGFMPTWRILPSYSQQSLDADIAHIRSGYLRRGYLDADVHAGDIEQKGRDVWVTVVTNPGHKGYMPPDICQNLLAQRREAQKQGIMEFTARFDPKEGVTVEKGKPYHVGRIEFWGSHHYGDSTLRRNFLLDEGQLFDEQLLRRSVANLNRTGYFENIEDKNVIVHPDPATGYADVTIKLTEKKRGAWNISGPVGPMSLAGPLTGTISSKLPYWSTYLISISMYAFAKPLIPIVNPPARFLPVFALTRPFTPGEGWKSGFVIAPQLGWQNAGLVYLTSQLQGRLMPRLAGESSMGPELVVTVARPDGDVPMYCEMPKPHLYVLRSAGAIGLHLLGALPAM
jgi:hypothetical protein